jgi:ABC transport system ATP-binding/permease protein
MATILTVQDLEKRFGNRVVLKGVSFAVGDRDRIGLIGANGSGKSTLLKMIVRGAGVSETEAALLEPDAGQITWRRDLVLEYVAQEPRLDEAVTIQTTLARSEEIYDYEIETVADALQLPPLTSTIGNLSIGERRRVALARALLGKPDILALDEPTNHLDVRTVEWIEDRLAQWPGALIVVTHDRSFLDKVATRICEMDRGKLHGYDGDYTEFLLKQAERLSVETEHERVRGAFVNREIDWIRRAPQARGVKAKSRVARFDAAVAARPVGDQLLPRELELRLPSGPRLGSTIIELDNVAKRVGEGDEARTLFSGLTLVMKKGDRIGIVGRNGAGKTTLIRTILGELAPDEGSVVVGQNTRPAYLEQSRRDLVADNTVVEEVSDGYDHVELEDGRVHVKSFLKTMGFPATVVDSKVGQLSGGERNRVQLAKLLRRGGNVLVLDEPTNDLDLVTLGALEHALIAFQGCALIVSHDRWFLDRVATGILAFDDLPNGESNVTFYEGSYSSYQAKRRQRDLAPKSREAAAPRAASPTRPPASKGAPKLSFKETEELAGMEAQIERAEVKVATLESTLFDPKIVHSRGSEIPKLTEELELARTEVGRLYARWQELEKLAAPRRA